MTTPEERDEIGEVIAEDAAERKGMITVMTSAGEACRLHPDDVTISFGSINADLRQQLADVSHERDLLRSSRNFVAKKLAEAMGMVNGASEDWTAEVYEILLRTEEKS